MLGFTYNELVDMFYNTFKKDITTNIKDKPKELIPSLINSYCDYMLSIRDVLYVKDTDTYDAYLTGLLKAKFVLA